MQRLVAILYLEYPFPSSRPQRECVWFIHSQLFHISHLQLAITYSLEFWSFVYEINPRNRVVDRLANVAQFEWTFCYDCNTFLLTEVSAGMEKTPTINQLLWLVQFLKKCLFSFQSPFSLFCFSYASRTWISLAGFNHWFYGAAKAHTRS